MSESRFRVPIDEVVDRITRATAGGSLSATPQPQGPPLAPSRVAVGVRDPESNICADDIIDIVTGPLGVTLIQVRIPPEQTVPLQLPVEGRNDDIIVASDGAERDGGIVSIEVTDSTQFFLGPASNPICLSGADGLSAARDALLDRDANRIHPESE